MSFPDVVSREEWLAARKELLAKEKELTRARDRLSADRRRLPMVEITKDYRFAGPEGEVGLVDLFEGRPQLMIYHFMFHPDWEDGCPSCSAGADETSAGLLDHLHTRGTTYAYVSRAPLEKLERYREKKGWRVPWYSSEGSDFNYDFHVTLDESTAPFEYNYRSKAEWEGHSAFDVAAWEQPFDLHGMSCFLRDGDRVFRTYSTYGRGTEMLGGSYYWLDLTALGRQEEWEEPKGRSGDARAAYPDFAS
jgi:predicted dithiol-disulfide oxidoreductase (DUF899 family)